VYVGVEYGAVYGAVEQYHTKKWLFSMKKIYTSIFFAAIINFAVFMIIAVIIGGDALSGKEEGGRYYVSNHGKLTEVSRPVFMYSFYHTCSIFITHPLGIIAIILSNRIERRKCYFKHSVSKKIQIQPNILTSASCSKRDNVNSTFFEKAIWCIPILCISGLIIGLIGNIIFKSDLAWGIGSIIFLSGFAVWGLANGGAFVWGFQKSLRERGFKDLREAPLSSALYIVFMLFFACVGIWIIWFIVRAICALF